MTGSGPGTQECERYLVTLRRELGSRGVRCDLRDGAGQLRLWVYCPGEVTAGDEPLDGVAVARVGGEWWYCWPQVTPICAVTAVAEAAVAIMSELGLGDGDDGGGDVADLGVWRSLRRARMEIFGLGVPGLASGGAAAGPHRGRAGHLVRDWPGGSGSPQGGGGPLEAVAAELAIAGFEVDVVDLWSDGRPAVLAVTSPATGACAEVTAHGAELELRCSAGGTAGLIAGRVAAVLAVSANDDRRGGRPAAEGPRAGTGQRGVLLARLRAELARLGVRASPQPGGRSLGIWPGLYAGLSHDGARYGWTANGTVRTHAVCDAHGAARRIAAHRDRLAGLGGWLV